ncbi:Putative major facilitator superfamily, MFS transporter superfamily [Septoria linicola]|uniref:Major facilitator superfamily, MFS transporter superfamily n=1 Tax=Septoria linicola TaxID=215465 RepID=A0A9Q9EMB0_9PEZI|nr:Putative major facilitator superfamily, MFS transporter superfamily [Septoria linicola]
MANAAAIANADTYLTGEKLWRAVLSLNICNIAAFCDIIGIGYVLEEVMDHYYDSTIVDWAPTAQLLGATVGQCVLGYLSDPFPRRNMLLFSVIFVFLISLGCALCIYSSNAATSVVVRTTSGVAFGSTTNLVNVAQNDFLPERRRLNFQGMQGGSVALGSVLGSLAGATLAMAGSWQCLYYIEAGLSAVAAVAVCFWLPPNKAGAPWSEVKVRLCTIDYFGLLSGIGCIVPGLLLMCRYDQFSLSVLISLTAITILCGSIFLYFGFTSPFDLRRYTTETMPHDTIRPIVPFRIFRNATIAALLT